MIKAVFFDMDGTLVSYPEGKIPVSAVAAIDCLRHQDILICAATGRCRVEMDSLDFLGAVDYDAVAAMNGQYCYTRREDIFANAIEKEDLAAFLALQNEIAVPGIFVEKLRQYINFATADFRAAMREIATELPEVGSMEGLSERDIFQIVPYCDEAAVTKIEERMVHSKAVRWSPAFVDVIPKSGGKVAGIEAILSYFHISWENVMAFGDGENDMDMLRAAKIGVAMGNAPGVVQAAADYVTDDAGKDGIAKALRHFGLLT